MFKFLILFIICIFFFIVYTQRTNLKTNPSSENPPDATPEIFPFKYKYILSNCEYRFYNTLKIFTDSKGYLICPKVGLKDLFDVTIQGKEYMKYWGKISKKHIDFLICDDKLHPLCAIELDDSSHNKAEAKENDEFKNKLFAVANLPLYRIPTAKTYTEEYIKTHISILQ